MSRVSTWFENLFLSCTTIIKVLILSKLKIEIPSRTHEKPLLILANGPSLTSQINGISDIKNYDLISVNNFPLTPYYKSLKPFAHVMVAPEYWIKGVNEDYIQNRNALFKALKEDTNWNIILFFPYLARNYRKVYNPLFENKNIRICYFNPTPIDGFKKINFWLMHRNLGMPRPHNVLIPSLILALNLGFKEIGLLGADHSWLNDIWVDENNQVLLTQKHFYDEDTAKALPMTKKGSGKRKLHEVLLKFHYSFRSYFLIKDYSIKLQAKIYNLTKGSYIDAFERDGKLIK